jgi:hypothetical protein
MNPGHTRPRSTSRDAVVIIDPDDSEKECLDPNKLLAPMLEKLTDLNVPLAVIISDANRSATYTLTAFTARLWPIRDGKVILGLKKIELKQLRARISFDIAIETVESDQIE